MYSYNYSNRATLRGRFSDGTLDKPGKSRVCNVPVRIESEHFYSYVIITYYKLLFDMRSNATRLTKRPDATKLLRVR